VGRWCVCGVVVVPGSSLVTGLDPISSSVNFAVRFSSFQSPIILPWLGNSNSGRINGPEPLIVASQILETRDDRAVFRKQQHPKLSIRKHSISKQSE
jgi:hypothetical protein